MGMEAKKHRELSPVRLEAVLRSSPDVPSQRRKTQRKVDQVMRKTMPSRKVAKQISDLLEEASAHVDGSLWQGHPASPQALGKAKRLLARYGRDIEDWQIVANYYSGSLPIFSRGYFDREI